VQNAEGFSVEVKWFTPKGTVDLDRELAKYRKTLERAAKKRRQALEWKAKPKIAVRESKPDKNRHFFAWRGDTQALGVIWYCRTCSRVILAQVVAPLTEDVSVLASAILSGIEDHGSEDEEFWSVYGLGVAVPKGWALEKHQLMAGYTMLQFRRRDRILRAERWALASVALRQCGVRDFVHGKSHKFWKDFRLAGAETPCHGHEGAEFGGRTRKLWLVLVSAVRRLIKRPAADWLSARAWHCEVENKIFAVHAIHPCGQTEVFDNAVESVVCHEDGN